MSEGKLRGLLKKIDKKPCFGTDKACNEPECEFLVECIEEGLKNE